MSPSYRKLSTTHFSVRLVVIVMQMFIAVINENFDVAEEAKKGRQASHYWASQRQEKAHTSWTKKLNPYRWFTPAPKAIAVGNLPSSLILPMQKALVQDYSLPKREPSTKVNSFSPSIFKPSLIPYRHPPKGGKAQGITPRARSKFCKHFSLGRILRQKYLLLTSRTYVETVQFHQTTRMMKWKAICT